jgi:septum formation protein
MDAFTGEKKFDFEKTKVFFRKLSDDEIKKYVDSKESLDKAGSYGIQGMGAIFVRRIEGCYTNVVGLPLVKLIEMLKEFGV